MERHPTLEALSRFAHAFKARPWLAWPLIVGNGLAVWWGYTRYYDVQLAATAWYLRPFVPDSPNAVGSFALALLLYQFGGRRWRWLDLLAFVWNIKVGLWTAFVLLHHHDHFFGPGADVPLQWALFWLHLGMVLQAFVLFRDLRARPPDAPTFVGLALLLVLTDVLDYVVGIHPSLDPRRDATDVGIVTASLSAATWLLAWLLFRPMKTRAANVN